MANKLGRPRKYMIEGKTMGQWAEHYGVYEQTIYNRFYRNNTVHPIDPKMRKTKFDEIVEGKSLKQWAEYHGISKYTIFKFYKKHGHVNYVKHARVTTFVEGKTIKEWADHYGVTENAIRARIKNGILHRTKTIIEGKSFREWAEHYGIDATTIRNFYIEHGHVNYVKQTAGGRAELIEGKTVSHWAEHYGVTQNAIRRRIKLYGNPHPPAGIYTG